MKKDLVVAIIFFVICSATFSCLARNLGSVELQTRDDHLVHGGDLDDELFLGVENEECYSSLSMIKPCVAEIISAVLSLNFLGIGPACCEALVGIPNYCLGRHPYLRGPLIMDHCSSLSPNPPAFFPAPRTPSQSPSTPSTSSDLPPPSTFIPPQRLPLPSVPDFVPTYEGCGDVFNQTTRCWNLDPIYKTCCYANRRKGIDCDTKKPFDRITEFCCVEPIDFRRGNGRCQRIPTPTYNMSDHPYDWSPAPPSPPVHKPPAHKPSAKVPPHMSKDFIPPEALPLPKVDSYTGDCGGDNEGRVHRFWNIDSNDKAFCLIKRNRGIGCASGKPYDRRMEFCCLIRSDPQGFVEAAPCSWINTPKYYED